MRIAECQECDLAEDAKWINSLNFFFFFLVACCTFAVGKIRLCSEESPLAQLLIFFFRSLIQQSAQCILCCGNVSRTEENTLNINGKETCPHET